MPRVALLSALIVAFCAIALAQEDEVPPLLADLAQLELHVVKTEIIEELRTVDIGGETVVKPHGTDRLVIVTLEGVIEESWRVTFATDSFAAIYETVDQTADDELRVDLRRSQGVSGFRDHWLLKPERGNVQTTLYLRDPGPVTIKAAFTIPADIDAFSVRIPTVAEGQAEVGEPQGP